MLYGQLGVAGAIALATALVSLYWPLVNWLETASTSAAAGRRRSMLFKFLDRRGEVGQVVGAEFLPPLAKQIEFDNVSLREPGTGRMLLEDVALTIPAGQRIGLVGADDLEKHALVYLIPRFLDPTVGEIRIDDHNLRWVTLDSLRAQIAIVLQHNLVFHDTVANNIGCGDPAYTLPQIIEAAKMAHAHHFIQKLPQGYETPIGELGHSLSISEQFRIALARAILRDPALLIIEEPDDAAGRGHQVAARRHVGPHPAGPHGHLPAAPHLDHPLVRPDSPAPQGPLEATGVHKELLAQNQLYRHLHYLEFNEMAEQVSGVGITMAHEREPWKSASLPPGRREALLRQALRGLRGHSQRPRQHQHGRRPPVAGIDSGPPAARVSRATPLRGGADADPGRGEAHGPRLWIVDPIDGTRGFAARTASSRS